MEKFLEDNYEIFTGLYTALSRTKSSAKHAYDKIIEAQKQYFLNHQNKVDSEEQNLTLELLNDAMHKFYLGAFALEQLWGVTNYLKFPNHRLPKKFNTPLTNQQSEITFVLAAIFDQSLFSWRSFIDYYMKYLLFFLTGDMKNNISIKKFRISINKHINLHPDAIRVLEIKNILKKMCLAIPWVKALKAGEIC